MGPVKPVNHTSWVVVVTPADHPKSVRNRCVLELFCGVVYLFLYPVEISVGVGAFVIGVSQISSFLPQNLAVDLRMFFATIRFKIYPLPFLAVT